MHLYLSIQHRFDVVSRDILKKCAYCTYFKHSYHINLLNRNLFVYLALVWKIRGLWGEDCIICFPSFPIKILAYEGAIFVPIAVPSICERCSPLNVKMLCFSTNVSNWTRHSVGGSLTALWSQASRHASIPSLCGMLVYNDVTSIEARMASERRGFMYSLF